MKQTESIAILAGAIEHNADKVNRDFTPGSAEHDAALMEHVEPLVMLMLCALAGTGDDIDAGLRIMLARYGKEPSW